MVLFHPSKELLKSLFNYHKAIGRKIEAKSFKEVDLDWVTSINRIGYTIRRALLTFSVEVSELPYPLFSIIEHNKPGFTAKLDKRLRTYLKLNEDVAADNIVAMFAEEFKACILKIGELEAEQDNWPYKKIYPDEHGNVIMVMNPSYKSNKRTIH